MGIKLILSIGIAILFAAGAFWGLQIAPTAQEGEGNDAEIKKLITELGDERFAVREKASKRLAEIGHPAFDALIEAEEKGDTEARNRATLIIGKIATANRFTIVNGVAFKLMVDKEWHVSESGEHRGINVTLVVTNIGRCPVRISNNASVFGTLTGSDGKEARRFLAQLHSVRPYLAPLMAKQTQNISFKGEIGIDSDSKLTLVCRDECSRSWGFREFLPGVYKLSVTYWNDETGLNKSEPLWVGEAETFSENVLIQ